MKLNRTAMQELLAWKNKQNRKPLVLKGARQVGKTWLMKEFASLYYQNSIYINFDNNPTMRELFALDFNIARIITGFEIYTGQKIDVKNTLIILDEIQEVPKALNTLKYFAEDKINYQIICAGSLLGVALHTETSFPVGKVDFLDLYPLSFYEFLDATGSKNLLNLLIDGNFVLANTFRTQLIELLKHYYFVGGMPEAVKTYIIKKDFALVRKIQKSILLAYEQDFSKHAPFSVVPRIRMVWQSIPSQLAKENKKFVYGLLKEGARAKEYETALLWLQDCGLVHKLYRIKTPQIPLKAYEDLKAFKLFILDLGLLNCMAGLHQNILLQGNDLFTEFKGALAEQFAMQELQTIKNISSWYWTNERGSAKIDFLLDTGIAIIPLEVKAEINLQAKSLKSYREKFNPPLSIRASLAPYKKEKGLLNLPLYALASLNTILD